MKTSGLEKLGIGTAIVGVVALLVFMPVITFWCAYFGGWILEMFVGERLISGLNLMFNTTRFTTDMIPLTCATFGVVGSYFKAHQTNNNK